MKKHAKMHVLEQQEAQAARQQQAEGQEQEKKEAPVKKKSSPRTLEKIKFQTKKKVKEYKRDIIITDDSRAMKMFCEALKTQRTDIEQAGFSQKS